MDTDTVTTELRSDLLSWARRQARVYSGGDDRPLAGYVGVLGAYAATVGAATGLAGLARRRVPDRVRPWDVALMAVATHRLSRSIAKDPVTSPLRAPFMRYEGVSAPSELKEDVRADDEARHSVGELLSCPMCVGQWVATLFGAGLVIAPRQTRLVMAVISAVAGADFLQYLYSVLQQQAEG